MDYGEEDLDWKVEAIPGKGLGIVALRDFPALTRVMVDRGYTRLDVNLFKNKEEFFRLST